MRIWLGIALGLLLAGTAQAAPWAGTYTTTGAKGVITLTLKDTSEGGVTGTLSGGGASYNLEGDSDDNGGIDGLTIDQNDNPNGIFTLKKAGNSIVMGIGDGEKIKSQMTFSPPGVTPPVVVKPQTTAPKPTPKTKVAAKPAVKAKPVAKATTREPSGGPRAGGTDWKSYTHPVGLKFRHPANWTVSEDQGILYVMPPDGKKDQFGATEGYMVAGQPAVGITSPEDPQVVVHLDQELRQMAPFLNQVGEVTKVRAANSPGIMAVWEGTNPRGQLIQARVYATLFNNHAVAVIALGFKNQILARENVVKTMFASLGAGVGKRDARLVGNWRFWSYKASADGKFGTEKTRTFSFRPDGTCIWSGKSESSGSVTGKDSLGNEIFNGGMAGGSNSGDGGKWSADNGRLYVLWNDGDSSMWTYRLGGVRGGRRLFLKGSGAEDEWAEVR